MFNTLLVRPLFNLLVVIYAYLPGHSLGLAVIVFTLLVRAALWPIVAKQLHSQKAMQALNPEIAKARAEAAGDKQKESQLLMELYKSRNINPLASLLPVLVQLPIFLALFSVLRDIIKPEQLAKLAYGWVARLDDVAGLVSGQSAINTHFLQFIDLSKPSPVLAVLAGILQYFQTKQIMASGQKDAQAQAMASMSVIFPVLTVVIGLTLPSALALYWVATSLVAIFQQWYLLKRDVVEMEAIVESTATEVVATEKTAVLPERKRVGKRK